MRLNLEDAFFQALLDARTEAGLTEPKARKKMGIPSRAAEGASVDDPSTTKPRWQLLADSLFLRTLADATGSSTPQAFIRYAATVAARMDPHDRSIADGVLALKLNPAATYRRNVLDRRDDLIAAMDAHIRPDGTYPPKPSRAKFAESIEEPVLQRLAQALDKPTVEYLTDMGLTDEGTIRGLEKHYGDLGLLRQQWVVVVGAAVMDVIFGVPNVPEMESSAQAHRFEMHPGGKGLSQAVAAARLGMKATLVAAVGDDDFGRQIMAYLEANGVDTHLMKQVAGEATPVTLVITIPSGKSLAIGWKNEADVRLRRSDIDATECATAIRACDSVLVTLEPPVDVVNHAITRARAGGRPTIVTPAPPLENALLDAEAQKCIDYLVANRWELMHFVEGPGQHVLAFEDPSELVRAAKSLLVAGVKHVLVIEQGQCFAFDDPVSDAPAEATPAWPTMVRESAGERDAFCGMLAHQLAKTEGRLTKVGLFYATAAMAYAGQVFGVPDSMPTMEDVETIIRSSPIAMPAEEDALRARRPVNQRRKRGQ